MHKHHLTAVVVAISITLMAGGCTSTSKMTTSTPVGEWEYSIPNTRQGDASGTISVILQSGVYSGAMYLDLFDQNVTMEEVEFADDTLMFNATFDTGQHSVTISPRMTLVDNNTMRGMVTVGGTGELEITAMRRMTNPAR